MKRFYISFILVAALAISSSSVSAQAFQLGNNVGSIGLGLGSSYGGFGAGSQTPAISLQYEHGQWEVGGPGVISIGGYLGYKGFSYSNDAPYYSFTEKLNYTVI